MSEVLKDELEAKIEDTVDDEVVAEEIPETAEVTPEELETVAVVTEEAFETVEVVAEEAPETVEVAVEEAPVTVEEAVEEAPVTVEEAVEEATETVEVVAEEAPENVEVAIEEAPEAVEVVAEEAPETVEVVAEEATETAKVAVEEATETEEVVAEEAPETAEVAAEEAPETVEVVAEEAPETVEVVAEEATETAEVATEEAPETVEVAAEEATETAEVATEETPDTAAVAEESEVKKDKIAEETMSDYEEHFDDANPWNMVTRYMRDNTNLTVTIEGAVNGGAITSVEGLRGFIPASRLSLSYVEDLEVFLNKEMEVRVIDVNQSENRLVLSAREILKEQENAEKAKQIQSIQIGSISEGVVETLQNYGAFVKLDSGLSGLVHVSQISHKRIKTPGEVLKVGNKVKVKIIGLKDGKISLSMKALDDRGPSSRDREYSPRVDIPKSENIGTSLGDLFKDIKLD